MYSNTARTWRRSVSFNSASLSPIRRLSSSVHSETAEISNEKASLYRSEKKGRKITSPLCLGACVRQGNREGLALGFEPVFADSSSSGTTPRISPAKTDIGKRQIGHSIVRIMFVVPDNISNLMRCPCGQSTLLLTNGLSVSIP